MPYSFFVLSGEHEELARDEVVAISKSYDPRASLNSESRLVIARSAVPWNKIFRRATFVRISGNIVGTFSKPSEIYLPVSKPISFACRTINLSSRKLDSSSLERQVGTILNQKWNSKVSLSSPHLTVYLIITNTKQYLGYSETQLVPKRPKKAIKRPHELDWKLSRCMVNLSRLRKARYYAILSVVLALYYLKQNRWEYTPLELTLMEKCVISQKETLQNTDTSQR